MDSSSRLAGLPTRPPTPPKETYTSMSALMEPQPQLPAMTRRPSKPTWHEAPTISRRSSEDASDRSSERPSKRVGFAIGPGGATPIPTSSPEILAPCSTNTPNANARNLKSILKKLPPQAQLDPLDPKSSSDEPRDFPRLLEDMTRELANSSLSCRLDAYTSLNRCLKTYKNQPALQALQDKMPILADFFQRDLTLGKSDDNVRHTQIATEVARLVTTLLWSPTMCDTLPNTLQAFLLDQAISETGSSTAAKVLVNQYLHLLSIQTFRSTVMTNDRANKLITNLSNITERTPGKQVVAHRLTVYRRLIGQVQGVMIVRVGDWIYNVFHGMMADTREIRIRAISLGLDAGAALGSDPNVSKAVKECFRRKSQSEAPDVHYADVFIHRLTSWLGSKEDARLIPQIWAAVGLLMRYSPRHFERWTFTVPWLKLMQKCFNSSDAELKIQANRAWGKFIFMVNPDEKTGDNMLALLRDPIKTQLDRTKGSDKESAKVRTSAHNAYYTLLYYAFRPGLAPVTIARHWDAYVQFVVQAHTTSWNVDSTMLCSVLLALFGANPPKLWTMEQALSPEQIRLDEIPRLDSKWVRLNAAKVLNLVEKLLMADCWWVAETEQSPIVKVWQAFCKCLGEAGSKEIKISMEAMSAMAEITGTISRFYANSSKLNNQQQTSAWSDNASARVKSLLQSLANTLDPVIFVEKRLVKNSPLSFRATETPSSRSLKPSGDLVSPVEHFLRLVTSDPSEHGSSNWDDELLDQILTIATKSSSSRRARLSALYELTQYATIENEQSSFVQGCAWDSFANVFSDVIAMQVTTDPKSTNPNELGQDFKEALKILNIGARTGDVTNFKSWRRMFCGIEDQVRKITGLAGPALVLIEPLSKTLLSTQQEDLSRCRAQIISFLLSAADWPESWKELDQVHRTLWGTPLSQTGKASALYPYNDLTLLASLALDRIMESTRPSGRLFEREFFEGMAHLMTSAPQSAVLALLRQFQASFSKMLEDRSMVFTKEDEDIFHVFEAAQACWSATLNKVEKSLSVEQSCLSILDGMLCAGLSSKHRAFANETISFWNRTFGLLDEISCSEELSEVLDRLSRSTEMLLKGIPLEGELSQASPIEYYDTPTEVNDARQNAAEHENATPREHKKSHALQHLMLSTRESAQKTPRKQVQSNRASTPRLRHDDSQIQFAVVDSSPTRQDSQNLTEHQREVKERQQKDASSMFADIRSSPGPRTSHKAVAQPRLQLKPNQLPVNSDIDDMQSPTLPAPGSTEFLGSSPTPSQRRSLSRDNSSGRPSSAVNEVFILELLQPHIPSSPPTLPKQSSEAAIDNASILGQAEPLVTNPEQSAGAQSPRLDKASPIAEVQQTGLEGQEEQDSVMEEALSAAEVNEASDAMKLVNIATQEPAPRSDDLAVDDETEESTTASEHALTQFEYNTVEAQIQIEMEKAFSQSQETKTTSPQPSQGIRGLQRHKSSKRKASPPPPTRRSKRGRGRPSKKAKEPQAKESTPATELEEEVLECIVLSSSPKESQSHRQSKLKRTHDVSVEPDVALEEQENPSPKRARTLSQSTPPPTDEPSRNQVLQDQAVTSVVKDVDEAAEPPANASASLKPGLEQDVTAGAAISNTEVTDEVDTNMNDCVETLAQARALLDRLRTTKLGQAAGDEIMSTIMDMGWEVLEAKRRHGVK